MADSILKILCPFCNAIQPSEVDAELESIHAGCSTCGYGSGATIKVEVKCAECKRTIYSKEGRYEN